MAMKGSVHKHGKYVWVQDVSADFVCIRDGEHVATIFSTQWEPWHIIFHTEQGALIYPLEFFDEPQAAMSRAEEVLDGVDAPPIGNSSA
jgi:hypothetical protein